MEHYKVMYEFYTQFCQITGKMLDNTMRHFVRRCVEAKENDYPPVGGEGGVEWARLMGIIELMSVLEQERWDHERQHEEWMQRLSVQKVRCQKLRKLCKENNIDISNV